MLLVRTYLVIPITCVMDKKNAFQSTRLPLKRALGRVRSMEPYPHGEAVAGFKPVFSRSCWGDLTVSDSNSNMILVQFFLFFLSYGALEFDFLVVTVVFVCFSVIQTAKTEPTNFRLRFNPKYLWSPFSHLLSNVKKLDNWTSGKQQYKASALDLLLR